MCMKNEKEYRGCADHLFINEYVIDKSIISIIEDTIQAEIKDKEKAKLDIINLLDTWHINGIMIPNKKEISK